MRNDLKEMLLLLMNMEYHTAGELAQKLNLSPKTVRNRLKELDEIGGRYGVAVESKPRYGYLLVQESANGINGLTEALEQTEGLPDTNEERTDYLLAYLLNHTDYTKIEELSDFLCVSRSTLQGSIREAEEILKQYHIELERRPNFGIRAKGGEFDIRRCVGECFVKRNMFDSGMQEYAKEERERLADMVLQLTGSYKISMSENAFETLITQICVAVKRMKRGCYVTLPEPVNQRKYEAEWKLAAELAALLEHWQDIEYTQDEICYIVIYLAGIRMIGNTENDAGNFVIREELDGLVLDMLELIYDEYRIELRNNFNLRMSLNQHMVPFDIRMRYHIKISNPILSEIKKNYIFAHTMARRAVSVLEEYYNALVSEEETGYFTMLLAFCLEQGEKDIRRVRILIVCGEGRGSSRMLRYKYEQEFGAFLEKIYICGLHELPAFDFQKVDYVFTTVPICRKVPVPITEVGEFLGQADIVKVKGVLEKGYVDFLDQYYRREQFLTEVEGRSREEVLRNLCREIEKGRRLPEGFYEAVMRREELAPTDFGNHIAMPHPYKIITEETFVYVAVLKHEVKWQRHPVQLLFLAAVSDKEDKNLQKFYHVTTNLFMQEDMVRQIVKQKRFSVLMQMLRQIYYSI